MFDELRGSTCILGRRFHLFGSSEGGIFRFRGRSVVVAELKGDICILGTVFRLRVLGWEAQRAAFFRFRGRLVVFDKLRGGTWILGRRFHLFGSSEGGIF